VNCILEPFRSEDRDKQVGDQAYPDETDDDVHGSDPFERCDVKRAENEKADQTDDVYYVDHNAPFADARALVLSPRGHALLAMDIGIDRAMPR
jgi:hypothetical protein